MRILNATAVLFTLVLQLFTASTRATLPADNATPLLWDPGATHEGTRVITNSTTVSSNFLFRITTANPSLAAWRTALNVFTGEADLYLSRGVPPSATNYNFKSTRAGSDGFILSSTQFAPNELWYILVDAKAGATFSLVSGAPYVQDIGAVAADDSSGSGGEVTIGPEGIRYFSASSPTDMLAWRLWLNGKTNNIILKKTVVPLGNSSEQQQAGQMLVVPPYLSGGQQYFIGVVGDPGTKFTLDSRRQPIIDLAYGASAPSLEVTNFPYTTYRIQVPAQQIAWRVSVPATQGNPNVSLRRNTVPNETYNDALSELAPPLTDNIALVPPVLSDGTFYVTVYSTNRHQFVLNNGPAVVTDINYIDTITNDDPDRVGWRYYRVTDISQQLGSLGWQLSVSNFAPGTRIAIRRNSAPSIWTFKNPTAGNATYHDLISVQQTLQDPGHQADVWYIGVYNPTNALGSFTLRTRELDPGPLLPSWQTASHERTNVTAGVWEYFRLDLPAGTQPGLGWDLRLQNVTGSPILVVRRDAFPTSQSGGFSLPVNLTNWPTLQQWVATADFTGRPFGNVGTTNENGRILTMPLNRPLVPGRYYVGVQSAVGSTQAISFKILSRWIGETMDIPVRKLATNGESVTNTVAPREAVYYTVEIPDNTRSFKARLRTLSGEAMVAVNRGTPPNISANQTLAAFDVTAGKTIQKTGDEIINLLPPHGKSVMTPGTYYIAVVGEGQSPPDGSHIGTGISTYVIETLGSMPETVLGVLGDELVVQGSLVGGDSQAYHFDTQDDVLGFWISIENAVGNPVPVSRGENDLADPGLPSDFYGNDGGQNNLAVSGNPIKVGDPFPTETIMVKARASSGNYPDATYTLRVKAIKPEALKFDGGVTNVAGADGERGAFFYVDVPDNALGWDLRLVNVTAGSPRLVISRDYIPITQITSPTLNTAQDTNWLSGEQWAVGRDWTDKAQSAEGVFEDGRVFATGMGRPLEPGRYYIGVFGAGAEQMSFTLLSRGIGDGMTIPVTPLAFDGGTNRIATLTPREAAYYSVDIPQGASSWKVHLTTHSGDALMIASQSMLPNIVASTAYTITNATGKKMNKLGDEFYLLLPPPGTNALTPGRHFITVISEGVGPNSTRLGTGPIEFTIASLGAAPVRDLGQLGVTDVVEQNILAGGDTQIYQFTAPSGTLGIEARLEDRVSNPVMVLRGGPLVGPPGAGQGTTAGELYGVENGTPTGIYVHPTLINVGDVTNALYTLVVMARSTANLIYTNTSYTLRLNASGTTTLTFDGGGSSVTNHAPRTWKYFRVTVPSGIDGWDLRLQNVFGGQPRLVIRRESLPSTLLNSPWTSPGASTNWPVNAQWAPVTDWTKRSFSSTNATLSEDGQVFACGMGRPLEPGNYFIGVYNNHTTAATSYSILSRGIGRDQSIPVVDVPYVGSYSVTLPARDAAYFRVVVPSNSPSWKVKVTGDSGEAMMVALRGFVPNIEMTQATASIANGKAMQKPGNEHFVLLPAQGQTNLPSSTNFFAVVSEGVNPAAATRIGSGSSSFTFESEGAAPLTPLGVLTSEDLVRPDRLQGGEVKAYQFLVPSGTLGFKVRLENREGNPFFVLRYGDKIPDPGAGFPTPDVYGNEGGYTTTDGAALLYTVPNPLPGLYTVAVKARPNANIYTDAGYALRIQEILVPELNFSETQNTNGLVNFATDTLDDNERVYYKFIIPDGDDVVGWKLELTQSSGLATMRVRRDTLPSDAAASTQMNFTSASAVIVPPYLTNGVWYVEVKGTGSTSFRLTSHPLSLERPVWNMPEPGQPSTTPGLTAPLFGDTGIDTNGVPRAGDASTFLEQGTLHYYAVSVPTNNYGVLRAVLEAISGNPDLYLRSATPPTIHHNAAGANGTIYDRSMLANATEYANWVPLDAKIEARLKPGLWYLAVRASGNANTRYRLKLSVGNVTEVPVHGPLITNQLLAGGDWRYYKFTAPETLPGGFNVQFSEQSGDVVVYMRDTIPPGNGITGAQADYKDWNTDNKNQSTYQNFSNPGTYSFAAPPVRPGSVYYVGVRAVSDAVFSIAVTTNGAPNVEIPAIPFYGGTISINLPPAAQTVYRIDVPADATRWKHTSSHAIGVQFYLEQGTIPTKGGSDDWRSPSQANTTLNQFLGAWPWVAGQAYFMVITNTTAVSQDITFAMDGRNIVTDDNDNDALPDAWELQYFGTTSSQLASGDPDRDQVTNYDEYLDGTNPNDGTSYRARLVTAAFFGTIARSPDLASYQLGSQVTVTAVPDAGYAFTGWSGIATGVNNPLVITMDGHKTLTAQFKLAGDNFVTALPISGDSATIVSSNVGMSKEPGEPNHAGNPGGKSAWWRWTALSSREVTLTTAGTPFSTLLGVYTGNSVSTLTQIASDSNSGGVTNRSIVKFVPISGTTYMIAVDGLNAASGRINLSLSVAGSSGGIAPTLGASFNASGAAQFSLVGTPNFTYAIDTSTNLVDWAQLTTVTMDANGGGSFTHANSPTNRSFYRTRH